MAVPKSKISRQKRSNKYNLKKKYIGNIIISNIYKLKMSHYNMTCGITLQ